jgi:hypothetical protein
MMNEEELLNLVTSVEGKYWYLKIPVVEDNLDGAVVTSIEMYIDRVGIWQEHHNRSDFTDSDLAVIYSSGDTDLETLKQSFYADNLFHSAVEVMITSEGFDAGLLEDLEVNPLEEQEPGRASFRASMLANYIREILKYYHF